MKRIFVQNVVAGAVAALLAAAPAQAVTTTAIAAGGGANGAIGGVLVNVDPPVETPVQGLATVNVSANPSSTVDYAISFRNNPVTAWIEFTADKVFDLLLVSYDDGADGGSDVTGYLLDRIGTPNTRLTTDVGFCGPAVGFDGANCNLVADADATGANGVAIKDAVAPVVLLSDLAAGDYRLGIYDSATPNPGSITLRVQEIPVPAAGLLLVGALGFWRLGTHRRA